MHGDIDDASFHSPATPSLWLRERLRAYLTPRFAPELREAYTAQFDASSRVLEATLEGLTRLFARHPLKALVVLGALRDWQAQYHGTQAVVAQADRYLVYTERDHAVPFRPEEDLAYAYMAAQLASVANHLADRLDYAALARVADGIVRMNTIGREAFRRYPTLTPRFVHHERLMLSVVQRMDAPVNCCPSLHIAYSVYIDNVAQLALAPHSELSDACDSIRASTLRMFNSVLYTKQHSLIDIAFGMLCARIAFEERFEPAFDDFSGAFDALAAAHPVPYPVIADAHAEARALYAQTRSLHEALGEYLSAHGYAKVPAGDDERIRFFDTRTRRIVEP